VCAVEGTATSRQHPKKGAAGARPVATEPPANSVRVAAAGVVESVRRVSARPPTRSGPPRAADVAVDPEQAPAAGEHETAARKKASKKDKTGKNKKKKKGKGEEGDRERKKKKKTGAGAGGGGGAIGPPTVAKEVADAVSEAIDNMLAAAVEHALATTRSVVGDDDDGDGDDEENAIAGESRSERQARRRYERIAEIVATQNAPNYGKNGKLLLSKTQRLRNKLHRNYVLMRQQASRLDRVQAGRVPAAVVANAKQMLADRNYVLHAPGDRHYTRPCTLDELHARPTVATEVGSHPVYTRASRQWKVVLFCVRVVARATYPRAIGYYALNDSRVAHDRETAETVPRVRPPLSPSASSPSISSFASPSVSASSRGARKRLPPTRDDGDNDDAHEPQRHESRGADCYEDPLRKRRRHDFASSADTTDTADPALAAHAADANPCGGGSRVVAVEAAATAASTSNPSGARKRRPPTQDDGDNDDAREPQRHESRGADCYEDPLRKRRRHDFASSADTTDTADPALAAHAADANPCGRGEPTGGGGGGRVVAVEAAASAASTRDPRRKEACEAAVGDGVSARTDALRLVCILHDRDSGALGVRDIRMYFAWLSTQRISRVVFLMERGLTSQAVVEAQRLVETMPWSIECEFFLFTDLSFLAKHHQEVPLHETVPGDEVQALLDDLDVDPARLPKIRLAQDPIAKYYGNRARDILRITSLSATAGSVVSYCRVV